MADLALTINATGPLQSPSTYNLVASSTGHNDSRLTQMQVSEAAVSVFARAWKGISCHCGPGHSAG
jgi:hypothetical protein